MPAISFCVAFFFFNDTATTEIYTLSLHDALPIWPQCLGAWFNAMDPRDVVALRPDRKSTRLNSSHTVNSYAVFCLKKKNNHDTNLDLTEGIKHPTKYFITTESI